jgi:hypothetical protein
MTRYPRSKAVTVIPDDRDARVRRHAREALADLDHPRTQKGIGRKVRGDGPEAVPGKLRELYRRFVPFVWRRRIRKYAKFVVATAGTVASLLNAYVPAWSPQVQAVLAVILGLGTILGVRQVPNEG